MQIIKQELRFEESLRKRLEFICEFSKVTPTFINGSIRKLGNENKLLKNYVNSDIIISVNIHSYANYNKNSRLIVL